MSDIGPTAPEVSPCSALDVEQICGVINAAAEAYRGVIPADCFHEPYMSMDELRSEIESGVRFWACRDDDELLGVMGSQDVADVTLIRHAYVRPTHQGRGIGHALLAGLLADAARPVLVGTWSDATWAIRFYERHGFVAAHRDETRRLLAEYWSVPERQAEESTVLTGPGWLTEPPIAGVT